MAHYKRKGPKSTRSGCLLCQPHKFQGNKKTARVSIERRLQDKISDMVEVGEALNYELQALDAMD